MRGSKWPSALPTAPPDPHPARCAFRETTVSPLLCCVYRKRPLPLGATSDCRKPPGELERAAALSNFQSRPAACTVGTGRFLRRKIPFSRAKIVSLQAPRPKNLRFLAETGEGAGRLKTLWVSGFAFGETADGSNRRFEARAWRGACFPVHQLVKILLTS